MNHTEKNLISAATLAGSAFSCSKSSQEEAKPQSAESTAVPPQRVTPAAKVVKL